MNSPARAKYPHCDQILASPPLLPYDLPMGREEVLRRLSKHRAELERLGVRSLHLFGSLARGDARPESDVDLLVEFDKPVGLFHFFRVQRRLEAILGRSVDLVMKDAIKRQLRTRILAEAVSAT
jgi:predicted nucleotidyltransferase